MNGAPGGGGVIGSVRNDWVRRHVKARPPVFRPVCVKRISRVCWNAHGEIKSVLDVPRVDQEGLPVHHGGAAGEHSKKVPLRGTLKIVLVAEGVC